MHTIVDAVALRPVTEADREFLVGLYGSTRDEELAPVRWGAAQRDAFVRMQFDLQDRQYRGTMPGGRFDVVEVDARPAGRLYVDRRADDLRIVDVALLPELRGRGIGTRLIEAVLDEAARSGRTASLHVVAGNRAVSLYTRLGFVGVADDIGDGLHRLMEWRAP